MKKLQDQTCSHEDDEDGSNIDDGIEPSLEELQIEEVASSRKINVVKIDKQKDDMKIKKNQ